MDWTDCFLNKHWFSSPDHESAKSNVVYILDQNLCFTNLWGHGQQKWDLAEVNVSFIGSWYLNLTEWIFNQIIEAFLERYLNFSLFFNIRLSLYVSVSPGRVVTVIWCWYGSVFIFIVFRCSCLILLYFILISRPLHSRHPVSLGTYMKHRKF